MDGVIFARMSWRPAGWQLCLGMAPVVVVVYHTLVHLAPDAGAAQVALYSSANTVAAVAAAVAARRHRPLRAAMTLIALAAAVSVAADVTFYTMALIMGEVAYPSLADIGYLANYPLLAGGLLLIVRRRTPSWDSASLIDAAIVAVSAGFLTYVQVIAPTISVTSGWDVVNLVSVAYPVGDLMLIAVGARLMLGAGVRTASLGLLGVFLVSVLYADIMYGVQTLTGTYHAGNYLDAVWITGSLVLAAAVLHPSLMRMAEPSSVVTPDATGARLIILALAATVAPTVMLVAYLRGGETHVGLTAITCNVLFLLVLARMAGLVRAQRLAAITDGLTGLRTRRFYEQALASETERSRRSGDGRLGVLLLDIDKFKTVNDTFGHHGGDQVLVEVAHRLRSLIRPGDLVARYGGEEFAVLMPTAAEPEILAVGERIRRGVAATPVAVGNGHLHRVTVSIGAVGLPDVGHTAEELMLAADRALYAAKDAGRNQVVGGTARDQEPAHAG